MTRMTEHLMEDTLLQAAAAAPGFMPPAEGLALFDAAAVYGDHGRQHHQQEDRLHALHRGHAFRRGRQNIADQTSRHTA